MHAEPVTEEAEEKEMRRVAEAFEDGRVVQPVVFGIGRRTRKTLPRVRRGQGLQGLRGLFASRSLVWCLAAWRSAVRMNYEAQLAELRQEREELRSQQLHQKEVAIAGLQVELKNLREQLEAARASKEETGQAEYAVLQAVRSEMSMRLRDVESSEQLQSSPERRLESRVTLRTTLDSHSLPYSEAQQDASERYEVLSDELKVSDIMCRRLRLDEEHFQSLAEQLQMRQAQLESHSEERLRHERHEAQAEHQKHLRALKQAQEAQLKDRRRCMAASVSPANTTGTHSCVARPSVLESDKEFGSLVLTLARIFRRP